MARMRYVRSFDLDAAIDTRYPEPGKPWDRGVRFAANGDDHQGTSVIAEPERSLR